MLTNLSQMTFSSCAPLVITSLGMMILLRTTAPSSTVQPRKMMLFSTAPRIMQPVAIIELRTWQPGKYFTGGASCTFVLMCRSPRNSSCIT